MLLYWSAFPGQAEQGLGERCFQGCKDSFSAVRFLTFAYQKKLTMPHYHSQGSIPHKRHTQFRKKDGSLYSEQLFSTEGFSNDYSLLYHCSAPTAIISTEEPYDVSPKIAEEKMLKHRSFEGFGILPESDYLISRKTILVNHDCHIVLAAPTSSLTSYFYKNEIGRAHV